MKEKSAAQIRHFLTENFPNADVFVADSSYLMPKKKWLLDKFYANFEEWLWSHNLDKWHESYDCDDYACTYMCFAQISHKATMLRKNREIEGIAVGEIWYHDEKADGGHAINIALCDNKLITIEPQTGKEKLLNSKERKSAWYIRM